MSFWEKNFSHVPHEKFPERDYVKEAKDSLYYGEIYYDEGRYIPLSLIKPCRNMTFEEMFNYPKNKAMAEEYEKKISKG